MGGSGCRRKGSGFFYPISIVEKEEILEKCRQIGICGICSIASDVAVVTVNYVAEMLGLNGNLISSTGKCTNKHLMRKAFEENGDPSPKSILISQDTLLDNLDITYPVIVKPTDRSGSRGIYKLESSEGLADAVKKAMSEGFEKKLWLKSLLKARNIVSNIFHLMESMFFSAHIKIYNWGSTFY